MISLFLDMGQNLGHVSHGWWANWTILSCPANAQIVGANGGQIVDTGGWVAIAKPDFPIAIDPPVEVAPGGGWIGGRAP